MADDTTILVTRLQRFSTQDGPGIRTTIFLQGCPLRCAWCHNPETQSVRPVLIWTPRDCVGCGDCAVACPTGARRRTEEVPGETRLVYDRGLCTACGACAQLCPTGACELSAKALTVQAVLDAVLRDKSFFGKDGGVTLSGGEPLFQSGVIPLMEAIRAAGLSLAVETAGAVTQERMAAAAPLADLWLYDLKDTNPERLWAMTGAKSDHILGNLFLCDKETIGRIRLRCILVRGVNTEMTHYQNIARVYHRLTRCEGVELIPYHAYAGSKAERIGRADNGRTDWIPTEDDVPAARQALLAAGVPVL